MSPLNTMSIEIALKKALTGAWFEEPEAFEPEERYLSAIAADVDGVRQYVQFLEGGVVGVAARDGRLLWHYDRPANGTANCSTPLFQDGSVFAASAYSTGGGKARLVRKGAAFEAREEYFVKEMQNHHGGMVLVGDHIYGTGSRSLLCIHFKTGRVMWNQRGVGKGSIACADGHLYVRGEDGTVALVEASPAGYKEKGRFDQPERSDHKAWPYPVVAGGRLYLRDWDRLFCYDVRDRRAERSPPSQPSSQTRAMGPISAIPPCH